MISIISLYDQLKGAVNEHQGGHIRPSDFIDWVHITQMDLYNSLIKEFQKTQQISDLLTIFLEPLNAVVNNTPGSPFDIIKKPVGYENLASARIIQINGSSCGCKSYPVFDGDEANSRCNVELDADEIQKIRELQDQNKCEINISIIDNDKWGSVCNHPARKISANKPVMTQYSGGFKLAPKSIATSVIMDCFRKPLKPIMNYTILNQGTEQEYVQFNQIGTQDLEWSETTLPFFLKELSLKYYTFVGNTEGVSQTKQ